MDSFDNNSPSVIDLHSSAKGPMSVILVMETDDLLESENFHEISDSAEDIKTINVCTGKCSLMKNNALVGPCSFHQAHLSLTSNLVIKDNTILPSVTINSAIKSLLDVVNFFNNSSHNYHKDLANRLKSEFENLCQFYNSLNERKKRKLPAAVRDACSSLNYDGLSCNEDRKLLGSEGYHSSASVYRINTDESVNIDQEYKLQNYSKSFPAYKSSSNYDSLDLSEHSVSEEINKVFCYSEVKSSSAEYSLNSEESYNSLFVQKDGMDKIVPKNKIITPINSSLTYSPSGSKLLRKYSLCNKDIAKYLGAKDFGMSGFNCFKDSDMTLEFVNSTPKDCQSRYIQKSTASDINEFILGCEHKMKSPFGNNLDQNNIKQHKFNSESGTINIKKNPGESHDSINSCSHLNVSSSSSELFNLLRDNNCSQNLSSSCNQLDINPAKLDLLVKDPNQSLFGLDLSKKTLNSSCDMISINNDHNTLPSEMESMTILHIPNYKISSIVLPAGIIQSNKQKLLPISPKVGITKLCLALNPGDSPGKYKEYDGLLKSVDRRIDISIPIDSLNKPCVHLERLDNKSIKINDAIISKEISDAENKNTTSGRLNISYCNRLPYTGNNKKYENLTKLKHLPIKENSFKAIALGNYDTVNSPNDNYNYKRKFHSDISRMPQIDTKRLCCQKIVKNIAIHSDSTRVSYMKDTIVHSSKLKPNFDIESKISLTVNEKNKSKPIFANKKKKKRSPYVSRKRSKKNRRKNEYRPNIGIIACDTNEISTNIKANSPTNFEKEKPSTYNMECNSYEAPPLKYYLGGATKKTTDLDLSSNLELNSEILKENNSGNFVSSLTDNSPIRDQKLDKFGAVPNYEFKSGIEKVITEPVILDNFDQDDLGNNTQQSNNIGPCINGEQNERLNYKGITGKSTPTTTDDDVMSILAGDLQDLDGDIEEFFSARFSTGLRDSEKETTDALATSALQQKTMAAVLPTYDVQNGQKIMKNILRDEPHCVSVCEPLLPEVLENKISENCILALTDNFSEYFPGEKAKNSYSYELNSPVVVQFKKIDRFNCNICETASSEKCKEIIENNYSKNWDLSLSFDSIFNLSEDYEISNSEKCSEFFREVSETNLRNCELSSYDKCSSKQGEISNPEKCLKMLLQNTDYKVSKKCDSDSTVIQKAILSSNVQVINKSGLKSLDNYLEINNNDSSSLSGCPVDALDSVNKCADQSQLSPKLKNLKNVINTLKINNILTSVRRNEQQSRDDLNISFTSSDFAVSETYCQGQVEQANVTISNAINEELATDKGKSSDSHNYKKPKLSSKYCSNFFYDLKCSSQKCSYMHKMPFSLLTEFLSDLIVYYICKKKNGHAWSVLKYHLNSTVDLSGAPNPVKAIDFAKCALKGLVKMQLDSKIKLKELELPKKFAMDFEIAKLEILCDQGKGKEAFEVLLFSQKQSAEPNSIRNLFFSFIRFCEMEVHGTSLSPYEKSHQWGFTKILSHEECILMKKELDCNWLLFHIQNNSLDMVIKCYGHLTSCIDLPKDCLAKLTLRYISFLKKNEKHSEIFEVLEKLKKCKLDDAKVFFAMCASMKVFRGKTYAYQFFEALTELKVNVISSNMCQSLIDITMLNEHDSRLMVKATRYCAEYKYQPSSKQLTYIIQQLIKKDIDVDWSLLLSFVNCLSHESLSAILKILEQFIRTVPPGAEADAIVRSCKSKGINLIPFVKEININCSTLPVQNRHWVNYNTFEQSNCKNNIFIKAHQIKESDFLPSHSPVAILNSGSSKQDILPRDHHLLNKFSLQRFGRNHLDNVNNERYNENLPDVRESQQPAYGDTSQKFEVNDEIIEEIEIIDEDAYGQLSMSVGSDYNLSPMQIDAYSNVTPELRNGPDGMNINSSETDPSSSKYKMDYLYIPLLLVEFKKTADVNCNDWNLRKNIMKVLFSMFTGNRILPIQKLGDIFDTLLNYLFDGSESKWYERNIPDIEKLIGHLGSSLILFCSDKGPQLTKLAENVIVTLLKRQLPFFIYLPIQVDLPHHTQRIAIMALQILITGNHMDEIVFVMEGMANMRLLDFSKDVLMSKIRVFKNVVDKLLSPGCRSIKQLIFFLKVVICLLKTSNADRNVLGSQTYEAVINIQDLLLNVWNWSCPNLNDNEVCILYETIRKLCKDVNIPLPLNVACEMQLQPLLEDNTTNNFTPLPISKSYPVNGGHGRPILGRKDSPYHHSYPRPFSSSRRPRQRRGDQYATY